MIATKKEEKGEEIEEQADLKEEESGKYPYKQKTLKGRVIYEFPINENPELNPVKIRQILQEFAEEKYKKEFKIKNILHSRKNICFIENYNENNLVDRVTLEHNNQTRRTTIRIHAKKPIEAGMKALDDEVFEIYSDLSLIITDLQ